MKPVYRMTDKELAAITSTGGEHPQYDEALEEEFLRDLCASDSRVAQAMGCAVGADNQPS